MAEPHPMPLPRRETFSLQCLDASVWVSPSHQKIIYYSFPLRKPIETVLLPGYGVTQEDPTTLSLTGPGPSIVSCTRPLPHPPSSSTEVANPDPDPDVVSFQTPPISTALDVLHSTKPSGNPPPSTIQDHTNDPGAQDEENEGSNSLSDDQGIESSTENTSVTSESQNSAKSCKSSADEYSSDPDFQRAVQDVS
jgi:hypothetical protein